MWSNVADCCKLWSKRGQENIEGRLFIFVVSICGQNIYFHDNLFYFIYQSMFLGDAPGPLARSVSGEGLRLSCPSPGVFLKFTSNLPAFLKAAGSDYFSFDRSSIA